MMSWRLGDAQSPHCSLALASTPQHGSGTSLQPGEGQNPSCPLSLCWWGLGYSLFCGVCLGHSSQSLKVFCLARGPFPGPLAREQAFGEVFCLSAPVNMPGLPASSAPTLNIKDNKKTQGTHHWVSSWVPRALKWCTFFPQTFKVSLGLFYIYIQDFFIAVGRRNREKYICSIFPKWQC